MAKYGQQARFAGLAGRSKYHPTEGWFDVRAFKLVPGVARRSVFFMSAKDERLVGILAAAVDARVFASVILDTATYGQRIRFTMTDVVIAKVAHDDEVEVRLDWEQMDYSVRQDSTPGKDDGLTGMGGLSFQNPYTPRAG